MLTSAARRAARGFTLIEILVVIAVVAILTVLTVPNFAAQMRNAQIRATAEQLQNDLRTAQAQAISQSRQVQFILSTAAATPAAPFPASAAANGTASYWYAATVPLLSGEASVQVATGSAGGAGSGSSTVTISVPATNQMCFSSAGRLTAQSPVVACSLPAPSYFTVASATSPANYSSLRVTVSAGGQVRICNPARSLPASPDGC